MMRSQVPALSVLRTKPITCGNQTYLTGSDIECAMRPAILFSKPSIFSLEKGSEAESAQTLSSVLATRSPVPAGPCADAIPGVRRLASAAIKTALLILLLIDPLRPAAPQRAIGPCLEIGIDIIEIKHHILGLAERRHDILGRLADIDPAIDDNVLELLFAHRLQALDERRGIGAAGPIRPMATQARFGIATPAIIGLLIDFAILDRIGLIALGPSGNRGHEKDRGHGGQVGLHQRLRR